MSERQQFRLGLVGYGEIGSTLGEGLRDAGLQQIFSYDKDAFDGPYAELIQSRAKAAGVTLVFALHLSTLEEQPARVWSQDELTDHLAVTIAAWRSWSRSLTSSR